MNHNHNLAILSHNTLGRKHNLRWKISHDTSWAGTRQSPNVPKFVLPISKPQGGVTAAPASTRLYHHLGPQRVVLDHLPQVHPDHRFRCARGHPGHAGDALGLGFHDRGPEGDRQASRPKTAIQRGYVRSVCIRELRIGIMRDAMDDTEKIKAPYHVAFTIQMHVESIWSLPNDAQLKEPAMILLTTELYSNAHAMC